MNMKTTELKLQVKTATAVFIMILLPLLLMAQEEVTEKFSKEFSVEESTIVHLKSKNGNLIITTWDKDVVDFTATLKIKTNEPEDAEAIVKAFKSMEISKEGNDINIDTRFYESFQVTNTFFFKSGKMKLITGNKVNIESFKTSYVLTVPIDIALEISLKYADLVMNDHTGNVNLTVYDGEIKTGNLTGDALIDLRYCSGDIGNLHDAKMELYDSDLEVGAISRSLTLNSKYSKLNLDDAGDVYLESYDDKIGLGEVSSLTGSMKYTTLLMKDAPFMSLKSYDSFIEAGDVNDLKLESKYTKMTFEKVDVFSLTKSYDDKITLRELGTMAGDFKYTNCHIDKLEKKLDLISYDDSFIIEEVGSGFERIELEGKYTVFNMKLPRMTEFYLDFDLTYPDIVFPEDQLVEKRYHKEGNSFKYKGSTPGASEENASGIFLSGYDNKFKILYLGE